MKDEVSLAHLSACLPTPDWICPFSPLTKTKSFWLPQLKAKFIIEKPREFIAVEMRKCKPHNLPAGQQMRQISILLE